MALDFLIGLRDESLVIPITCQGLPKSKHMLGTIITFDRLGHCLAAALHPRMTQLGQSHRIALAGENRIQNAKSTQASDIT
jgi:hypothetical protein